MSLARPSRPSDNPFASHRVEALHYRACSLSRFDLERRIDALGGLVAIVGAKGSGKTTLLEELGEQLPGPVITVRIHGSDPHPYRAANHQLPDPVTSSHTILVDGAEQLGALSWRTVLNRVHRARRLVATHHRPGRLPTLIECTTSPALLCDLVRELAPENVPFLEPTLENLFHRHDGNIRSCLRELYDVYAGRKLVETLNV